MSKVEAYQSLDHPHELHLLRSGSLKREVSEILYDKNDTPLREIYKITEGMVKVVKHIHDKECIVDFVCPGDFVGFSNLKGNVTNKKEAEKALLLTEHLEFLTFDTTALSPLNFALLAIEQEKRRAQFHTLKQLSFLQEMTAYFLLETSERLNIVSYNGEFLEVPLTHEKVGELLGCTRESTTSAITQLRIHQVVRSGGGGRILVRHSALKQYVEKLWRKK